jgi:acyl carrier protein
MKIEDFIRKIEDVMDDIPHGSIQQGVHYKDIENWSSMHALMLMAMVDNEYDVLLSGEDMVQCLTVDDLFEVIKSKKK